MNVLILTEVGQSHSQTALITQQLLNGSQEAASRHVEFYSENLDLLSLKNDLHLGEVEEWLVKKYRGTRIDVVVAIGPDVIDFLASRKQSLFVDVPVVICGATADQAGDPVVDSRFTGTWQTREPVRTMDAMLQLLPLIKHVYVVAGNSRFDRFILSATQRSLAAAHSQVDLNYLTDLTFDQVLQKLANLPANSAVFYLSYFEDAEGERFINATTALPMVAQTAKVPVFGMSDTYLGHGIVGGDVMNFEKQGRITAQIVSELLNGKKPEEIPIQTLASEYMFDWKELHKWGISERALPKGSVVMFREATVWERTKWIWVSAGALILSLTLLVAYLLHGRKELQDSRTRQRQLSGRLIDAGERERTRVAHELHDDFSQRLAVMALKLENVSELVAPLSAAAGKQLRELLNSTSELGEDLHSLSHRLHSSTLQSLGLVPAVSVLCKEFTTQESVNTDFSADNVPKLIHPDVALCSFRIVQEGLRNIKHHSAATSAKVTLKQIDEKLVVSIKDNGCGFDPREVRNREGLGLRAMEERASFLGGEFKLSTVLGGGTTIEASIPLNPPNVASATTSENTTEAS